MLLSQFCTEIFVLLIICAAYTYLIDIFLHVNLVFFSNPLSLITFILSIAP